jgi:hypothetical protein
MNLDLIREKVIMIETQEALGVEAEVGFGQVTNPQNRQTQNALKT